MFKIVWVNDNDEEFPIGEARELKDAVDRATSAVKILGYEMPYFRIWKQAKENYYLMDFGSHTEFIKIYDEE